MAFSEFELKKYANALRAFSETTMPVSSAKLDERRRAVLGGPTAIFRAVSPICP
jgi:hypothetical protein